MNSDVSHLRAIGYAVAAFTLWVLSDSFMKAAGEAALPPYEVIGFLGLFYALLMAVKAAPQRRIKALWPQRPSRQLARASLSLGSNFFNVIALKHLPLDLFYVTVFSAPMMIVLLAALCLRENLSGPKILAVLVGFGGVIVAIDPFDVARSGDWIGYAAATASTTCFAASTVWLRVMTQSESVDSLAFFTGVVEGGVGLAAMLILGAIPVGAGLLAILFGMSLFGIAGNVFYFKSLRFTSAANVAQFHYTQIIAGTLIGYLVWHDIPAWHTVWGACVIVAAGLYIAAHAHRAGRAPAAETA